jgi:copper transport protein
MAQAAGAGDSDLFGSDSPLLTLLGGTRYGAIVWMRLLLLAVLAGLLFYGVRRGKDRSARLWPAASAVALLVLLTTSLNSHAAAGPLPFSAVAGDWVHLASASIWLGGLIALVVVLASLGRSSSHRDPSATTRMVADFAFLATLCIVALGTTGLLQALDHLASWEDLFDTPYGTALLVKLGLLLPLFGLAAANRSLTSRLGRSGKGELAKAPDPWQGRILRNAGGEIAVGVAVLLVTSALTALVPAHDAFGPGLVLRSQESGVRATLVVSPGLPGANRFDVYLKQQLWSPVEAEKVALILSSKDQGIGQTEAVAADQGGGHYLVQGNYLSVASTWQIELLVRRSGQDDVRLDFTVPESELSEERFSRGGHVH